MTTANISHNDVITVRSWLEKQEHLPSDNIDDHLLARFLHCCDNNIEKCKTVMEHFFKLRADAPEFFTNRDPTAPNIKMVFQIIDIIPLPKLTAEGYKVFLFRLSDPDPDKFDYMDYLRTFFIIADTRMKTEKEFPTGEVPIFDMAGFTFRHLMKMNFSALRKQMQYVQEAHPVKLKQVHVINTLPILERVMVFLKPLIKKQVAAMLHFHVPNSNTLEKFIPKHILPDEYGGQAGPLSELKQTWISKAQSEREWLISNPWHALDTKTPQNKNKEKQKLDSSFKSLSID